MLSKIVQGTTLTALPPFSTRACWVIIFLQFLGNPICDLNFLPNLFAHQIEIPAWRAIQNPWFTHDWATTHPKKGSHHVPDRILHRMNHLTHFCHSGSPNPLKPFPHHLNTEFETSWFALCFSPSHIADGILCLNLWDWDPHCRSDRNKFHWTRSLSQDPIGCTIKINAKLFSRSVMLLQDYRARLKGTPLITLLPRLCWFSSWLCLTAA